MSFGCLPGVGPGGFAVVLQPYCLQVVLGKRLPLKVTAKIQSDHGCQVPAL